MPHAKCRFSLQGVGPASFQLGKFIRMDDSSPCEGSQAFAFRMLKTVQRYARKVDHAFVQIGWLSVGCRTPDQRRNGVDEQTQLSFAAAQGVCRLLLIVHVDRRALAARHRATRVACGSGQGATPTKDFPKSTRPLFCLAGLVGFMALRRASYDATLVFGMELTNQLRLPPCVQTLSGLRLDDRNVVSCQKQRPKMPALSGIEKTGARRSDRWMIRSRHPG
jgi:hypothetical protein